MTGLSGRIGRLRERIVDRTPRPTLVIVGVFEESGVKIASNIMWIGLPHGEELEEGDDFRPFEDLIPQGPDRRKHLAMARGCGRRVDLVVGRDIAEDSVEIKGNLERIL